MGKFRNWFEDNTVQSASPVTNSAGKVANQTQAAKQGVDAGQAAVANPSNQKQVNDIIRKDAEGRDVKSDVMNMAADTSKKNPRLNTGTQHIIGGIRDTLPIDDPFPNTKTFMKKEDTHLVSTPMKMFFDELKSRKPTDSIPKTNRSTMSFMRATNKRDLVGPARPSNPESSDRNMTTTKPKGPFKPKKITPPSV